MNTYSKKQIDLSNNASGYMNKPRITIESSKWNALFFICFYSIVQFYCYDMPSLMETQLIEHFKVTNTKYSLMYSFYSMPNIIFPFFGGYLCDKIGTSKLLLFASIAGTLGQTIVFIGAALENFYVMLFGRFLFGTGSEFLLVL